MPLLVDRDHHPYKIKNPNLVELPVERDAEDLRELRDADEEAGGAGEPDLCVVCGCGVWGMRSVGRVDMMTRHSEEQKTNEP